MIPRHTVEYAIHLCESLRAQYQQGLDGGVVAQTYIQEKLEKLEQTNEIIAHYGMVEKVEPKS